nr:beta-ketoacyl synthase N-terminal-like domain-containing protein [uncultured Shinella sp.]
MSDRRDTAGDIAIIGMAGRFPGAGSVEALWQMLCAGGDAYAVVPEATLARSIHRGVYKYPAYVPVALPLKDYDRFDAGFFGYSPREASFMEPQQRLLLECAWHVFEAAGRIPGDAAGQRTAVFASTSASSYLLGHVMPHVIAGEADMLDATIGTDKDYAATRIAYRLGLQGPALAVQTACSSSLVATHLACQSLLSHESDAALVAACSLPLPNEIGYMHAAVGIRSRDGRCRPFDAQSSGTLFGAGAAAVLLRRYDDAIADGDPIVAIIRGSAINNDGATRLGFTAPAIDGQVRVVTEALAVAGIDPAELGYIECHGTGTPIGDPVEISALQQAIGTAARCTIGSIKSNIGHLDTVAGLAGLIKAALIVSRGRIPAMATFSAPNPALRLETTPFRINADMEIWDQVAEDRIAGVSSFGFGGTNAHVVLSGAPAAAVVTASDTLRLLPVSAHDPESLETLCADIARTATHADITSLADSLSFDRKGLRYRRFAVAKAAGDIGRQLATAGVVARQGHKVAFLFPGQGSQFAGMATGPALDQPGYRDHLEEAVRAFEAVGRTDLRPYLLDAAERRDCGTALAQAALFATQYALGRLLLDWGILPDAMIGHSIGEYSAACVSGIFDLSTAARLVSARGEAMALCPRGAMALVALAETEAEALIGTLGAPLSIACSNTPHHTVLGGTASAVEDLIKACAERGISAKRLDTAHAFHTADMAAACGPFAAAFAGCVLRAPQIPIVSTRTGRWLLTDEATDPGYWAGQLRDKVRFSEAVQTLLGDGEWVLGEVGAAGGLSGFVRSIRPEQPVIELLPGRGGVAVETGMKLLHGVGTLWQHGASLDWQAFAGPRRSAKVALPLYPFRRDRHWLEPAYDRLMAAFATPLPDILASTPEPLPEAAINAPRPAANFAARPLLDTDYRPPIGELETQLKALFEGVLYTSPIGRDDDFFSLGGQSILILDLVRRARSDGLHLEPSDLFEGRTIAALAAAVTARTTPAPAASVPQNQHFDVDGEDLQRLLGMIEGVA